MSRSPFSSRSAQARSKERRREEAARWLVVLREADLSDRALKSWKKWESVPENREAFEAVERVWTLAVNVPTLPGARSDELSRDGYDGSMSVSSWQSGHVFEREGHAVRRFSWRRIRLAAAVAALMLILVVPLLQLFIHSLTGRAEQSRTVFVQTDLAQHKQVTFEDGSAVQLGARTALVASFSRHVRSVALDHGEAHFDVARDPQRQFQVTAGGGAITAVGTAFNVHHRQDSVVVTVTEGTVHIALVTIPSAEPKQGANGQEARAPVSVSRGQEITYDAQGNVSPIRPAPDGTAVAWRKGYFVYNREALTRVVQDVNRYSPQQVLFADSAAGNLLYSGTVITNNVEEWIHGLAKIYPQVEVLVVDDTHTLIRTRTVSGVARR